MPMQFKPLFPDYEHKVTPWVIAGPCSAESREQLLETAAQLQTVHIDIFRAGIWKPRTKPGSFEGVGQQGFEWMQEVKERYGMRLATEVATPRHVELALQHQIDLVWIGARTVTNPFAMQSLAQSLQGVDLPVLVKNPVNPDLELWLGGIERLYRSGINRLGAIHRGFSTYKSSTYRNTPFWNIVIELHRQLPQLPIFCDPSHMGGRADLIAPLAQEAMELQMQGLFIEAHCNPTKALSDSNQQITPHQLGTILAQLITKQGDTDDKTLHELRLQIDALDLSILEQLARRMELSQQIGAYKETKQFTILQPERYNTLLNKRLQWAKQLQLDPDFVETLMQHIHQESVRLQLKRLKKE